MKRISIVAISASALLFALPAAAADLISYPTAVEAVSIADWSGVYIGGHIGFGFSEIRYHSDGPDDGYDPAGFLAGAQIGVRQQSGDFVLGVQGDVSWSGVTGLWREGEDHHENEEWRFNHEWQASLTGRGGVVVDQALLYGLAGVTVAGGTEKFHCECEDDDASFKSNMFGVTVGAGVELKVADNVSIFGEYAFTQFADFKNDNDDWMGGHSHAVKAGVNFSF